MQPGAQTRRIVGLHLIHALVLLGWTTQFAPIAPAAELPKHKRVLTLYWYGKDFSSNVEFDRGLQKIFRAAGIEYYPEYFEPNRFPGEVAAITLRDYLQRKYSDRPIDVVIAMSPVAADFLLKYRDQLFSDVPIVFHTSSQSQLKERTVGTDFPGVTTENIWARTLQIALNHDSNTKQVFVINGTIERGKAVEALLKESLKEFESKVKITYLTDLTLDELIARVKRVPERSVILYSQQDYEEPGRTLSILDVLLLVANSAKVPIYSSGSSVGYGTIGGYAVNTYECGIQAANMAVRILDGIRPQDISSVEVPSVAIFDWRQLRRWGIRPAELPAGSEVRFEEPTVFEQYRVRIIGGFALCVLQSFLIAGLLAERQRRRRAQAELRERLEFETLLSELSADFTRLPGADVDRGITGWLQRIGDFLGGGSGALFKPGEDRRAGGEHFDPEATAETAFPEESQRKFALAMPIHINGSVWTLTFSFAKSRRVWPEDLLPRLRLAGEIMAGALVRKAGGDALQESQQRYKLATTSGAVVVWDWDFATSEVYADPLLNSLLGCEEHEIRNFDDWMRLVHPEDVNLVLEGVRAHLDGELSRFAVEHRFVQRDGGVRWFSASGTVVRNEQGIAGRMVGTETDITERKLAEQELQHLSRRLLDLQDQERQRIARELHDGTAQNISAIGINLEYVRKAPVILPPKFRHALSECRTLCEQSLRELRTVAYVLHPPMLDHVGLFASLRSYVDGFAKRTGLDIELSAIGDVRSLPSEIEMDLFRIVQECVSNVHCHSGSRTAQVRLERRPTELILRVEDQGRGMPVKSPRPEPEGSFGVGLSGIRQRLRHLGGRLEIASTNTGTTITAIVPLGSERPLQPSLKTIVARALHNSRARNP